MSKLYDIYRRIREKNTFGSRFWDGFYFGSGRVRAFNKTIGSRGISDDFDAVAHDLNKAVSTLPTHLQARLQMAKDYAKDNHDELKALIKKHSGKTNSPKWPEYLKKINRVNQLPKK